MSELRGSCNVLCSTNNMKRTQHIVNSKYNAFQDCHNIQESTPIKQFVLLRQKKHDYKHRLTDIDENVHCQHYLSNFQQPTEDI